MPLVKITRDGGKTIEEMDESLLVKKQGSIDTTHEQTNWVEYWLDEKLVHRSAHVTLKDMPKG